MRLNFLQYLFGNGHRVAGLPARDLDRFVVHDSPRKLLLFQQDGITALEFNFFNWQEVLEEGLFKRRDLLWLDVTV